VKGKTLININTGLANDPYNRFNDGDPCANKHNGNAESRAAWDKAKFVLKESQEVIFNLIKSVEPEGITGKEAAEILDKGFNAISGRITELFEMDLVYDTTSYLINSPNWQPREEWSAIDGNLPPLPGAPEVFHYVPARTQRRFAGFSGCRANLQVKRPWQRQSETSTRRAS